MSELRRFQSSPLLSARAIGTAGSGRRRALAAMEHASYLRRLDDTRLAAGRPFDLHHQSILRLALLHGVTNETPLDLAAALAVDAATAPDGYELARRLQAACAEFISLHELGHRLVPARSPRTTRALARHVERLDDVRFTRFPDGDRLASWSRLRRGT